MAEDKSGQSSEENPVAGWKVVLPVCLLILLGAGGVVYWIFNTEPEAQRETATRETPMLVEVQSVSRGTYRPEIEVLGTVEPAQDVMLSPRVSGEILELGPHFTPGGFVEEGEMLVRIDPADFENILEQRRSELQQAEADLRVEEGRQNVARQDYELLDQTLAEENRGLVLREPQLNAARAVVKSAQAAVRQAELDLQRSEVKAPFRAQVIERFVNVGSQVSPGENLAHLVGIETYWVVATVPLAKLRWVEFPAGSSEQGAEVRVRNRSAWPQDVYRVGRIDRLIGSLDDETRLARVLVTVNDPLNLESDSEDAPAMIIGTVVETRIQGREIPQVVRLDRDLVRDNDTVWVKENGELRIKDVKIEMRDAHYAYISEGLNDGDEVVTTNLATIREGAPLRLVGSTEPDPDTAAAQDTEPGGSS